MKYTTIISSQNLQQNLQNPDWVIFDCRSSLTDHDAGYKAYQAGHIPNARYCHLEDDLSSPISKESGRHPPPFLPVLIEKLGKWGVNNNSQVIVYDDAAGAFAVRMWWQLRDMGHNNVAVLDGGINQWLAEDKALSKDQPQITPREFIAENNTNNFLTTQEIEKNLLEKSFTVLDARTTERFRGEAEPIDMVAGRIPGSINHAFQSNLNEKGLFLSPDELRLQFERVIGDTATEDIVHMCGSGVTACHNMLAMEIADLSGSRIYLGSWSEWIRDETRPIATG